MPRQSPVPTAMPASPRARDLEPFSSPPDRVHRARRALLAVMATLAVGVGACSGGDGSSAGPGGSPRTVVDPETGETVEVPDDFGLSFGTDEDGSTPEAIAGPTPSVTYPTPDPLEEIVIDDVVVEEGAGTLALDEPGALVCANTEFALDALIDDDADALDERLSAAAEWADQTSTSLAAHADSLRSTRDGDATEELVVAVLGDCAEKGYEL